MSGSNKFARGGGRGPNRMVPLPLGRGIMPLRRGPAPAKEKGRPDDVSMKGRGLAMKGGAIGAGSAGGHCQEEDFQLVSCQEQDAVPLFAMAIRLTPGLLETLKRVEELGETTTMKFGANASGHVIKVAEEEFRFSSAPEPGHLCDIFEEQHRGEDGNGLLVESGAVWRKLSVIRTLSATDKNRVKARSVEAERQQKSRKAIILDHNNSLMNNKAATSGDVNGRRAPVMKPKKEPPQKKRKIMAATPVIPPLSAVKTRPMPTTAEKPPVPVVNTKAAKANVASSPEAPPALSRAPLPQAALVPPLKPKGTAIEEVGGPFAPKTMTASQKDKVSSPALPAGSDTGRVARTSGVVNMTELRNCLITLLVDNPKGMTIKAVEKALGEAMPNVRPDKKQIEKVIKAIALYQTPGKYMLKEGVEKGSFAKPSPGSGSSPETLPVDSPPLADSPTLIENVPETQQETGGNVDGGGDRSTALHQDLKRADGTGRNSSLPLQRGGENAVSRAIRKAGEMFRGNAERQLPSGYDKPKTVVESPEHKLEDLSLKEATVQGIVEVDHVSIGGDESPVSGSPEHEHEGKLNGMEVENTVQDLQPHEVDLKKENSDGSDSSSASSSSSSSGSESESDSASGSRSGSGSDTESDGSSSSASDEENMDEDVDIISDDEDKAVVDVAEALKQKPKSKDARSSLERQESKIQKQASRSKDFMKKQKSRETEVGMTPHESEDADIGDGAEGGEISKFLDINSTEKGAKGSNSEEEVDVVVCDEDTPSPQEQGIASPAESGKHSNDAIYAELGPHLEPGEEVKDTGQDNLQSSMQPKSGSESDHSIEEYETRAENSGVRGARVKVMGDQKLETQGSRIEDVECAPSPRSKGSSGTSGIKLVETPDSIERENKTEAGSDGTVSKGLDLADSLLSSKEQYTSGGASVKLDSVQKSLLGTPPMLRDGLDQIGTQIYREAPTKSKTMESKKKDVESIGRMSRNSESGEIQEKSFVGHRGPQRVNKMVETSSRSAKSSEALLKSSGDVETPVKAQDRMFKSSEVPGLIEKGADTRETLTADGVGKFSMDGDTLETSDVQRKQNREAGLLGKPGKASELVGRMKGTDQSGGLSREKDATLLGRPGRNPKQVKKPGPRRVNLPERAGTASELGEKHGRDNEIQRRPPRDGESLRKSPKAVEPDSRIGHESEVHSGLGDMAASKAKVSRMTSDLELGELRDIVAGQELRAKDSVRNEPVKLGERSDLSSRQLPNKAHTSPDKDKPRHLGKQGDVKKRSPVKQPLAKKDSQRVEVPISLRDNVRPSFNAQKVGAVQEETGSNRASEAIKTRASFGDHHEKQEGRSGKRPAEEGGDYDPGRLPKRAAVDLSQVATSLGRAEPDSTSYKHGKASSVLETTVRTSSLDMGKGIPTEGGHQLATNSSRAMGENGRVPGPKSKGYDGIDKEVVERRGPMLDGKQKTTAGLLGPGSKRETQSNGKNRSTQTGDVHSREFFALYEKRTAELRGPISHYDQYLEYCKEYHEKYPVYVRLNTVLESDKEDFEIFSRDINVAKAAEDRNKLGSIYGKVRKDYSQCRKRFKRMQKTFIVLHDELRVIKQRCKEYAEKVAPKK